MDKRCAIVNYWWANGHGAALTAFALSKLLSEHGYEPCLIKTAIGISGEECEKGINFQFISRHVKCTRKNYRTFEEYKSLNQQFAHFILGSDQVLRLEWIPDEWLFNAVDYDKNILAVSASFGITEIHNSKSRIRGCGYYLSRFNAVSLRELSGRAVYQKYFGARKGLETIADPVFLVDRSLYDEIARESRLTAQGFIFFYILDQRPETESAALRMKQKLGLPIIRNSDQLPIEDFLYYIKNGAMVVTDSFHGLCFSVIYNKPFYCIYNAERGAARIESLIETMNLDERYFLSVGELKNIDFTMPTPDYSKTNCLWRMEQERGVRWIVDKLRKPAKKRKRSKIADGMTILLIRKTNRAVGRYLRWKKKRG